MPIVVETDTDRQDAMTENLGVSGIFVATERPAQIGARVSLRFTLPGEMESFALEAEVRWIRFAEARGTPIATGMGLKFGKLNLRTAASLDAFLRRLARAGQ